MPKPKLRKPQHAQFIRLYLGRDPKLHGNATRCYLAVYGDQPIRSAQVSASRLLQREDIQAHIADFEHKALEQAQLDAGYVLAQSRRLFERAMGDEPIDETSVEVDEATGEERVTFRERRDYDPATARAALQLIGQHRDIQAFSQTIEVSHTHHLEQRLAARSKAIEGRATRIPAPSQVDDRAGRSLPNLAAAAALIDEPGEGNANARTEGQKRVHPAGGQIDRGARDHVSAPERAGATGD